jgi:hypothetical protein
MNSEEPKVCCRDTGCCKMAFTSEPAEMLSQNKFIPYDPSQELIFPPFLQVK